MEIIINFIPLATVVLIAFHAANWKVKVSVKVGSFRRLTINCHHESALSSAKEPLSHQHLSRYKYHLPQQALG